VQDSQPLLQIVGERVALGPLLAEHAPAVAHWYADYGTLRNWAFPPGPRTVARLCDFGFDPNSVLFDADSASFAIYTADTLELVGMTGLIHVDHIDRIAEFYIMIGKQRHRGQGYGTEATRLVLDHAFLALGLSNVILRVFSYNLAGIRAYEKAGFRQIGARHKSKMMGGQMWDTILMEAVADEFESPVLGRILVPDEPRGGTKES
jgi:diamine N-acetyltransferase